MLKQFKITPVYVNLIPEEIENNKLYISKEYKTAIHLCACGCGEKTVTPLGINWWSLVDVNGAVTLDPSIGNSRFPCKSHYRIINSVVIPL